MAQITRHTGLIILISAVVAAGWLFIAVFEPTGPDWPWGVLGTALVLGTIFGQASLAGAWCALGPYALIRRMPLSLAWVAAIVVALGSNIARSDNSDGFMVLLVYAGAVAGQWLLVQVPLWLLAWAYGVRIVNANDIGRGLKPGDQQFGIREVMIVTFLVALVLGAARIMLGGLKAGSAMDAPKWVALFGYMAAANAVIALPLVVGALVPRRPIAATAAALAVGALATALELSLLEFMWPGPPPAVPRDYTLVVLLNAFQCVWVFGVLLLLRTAGFRLFMSS